MPDKERPLEPLRDRVADVHDIKIVGEGKYDLDGNCIFHTDTGQDIRLSGADCAYVFLTVSDVWAMPFDSDEVCQQLIDTLKVKWVNRPPPVCADPLGQVDALADELHRVEQYACELRYKLARAESAADDSTDKAG